MKQIFSLLFLAIFMVNSSCVKTEFDEPPVGGEGVDLVANTTIQALKLQYTGTLQKLAGDILIAGEIVMDDASGNYYKTLVLQDATGGIEVKFNDGYLATTQRMPIGRKIAINCKDLYLTDYNGIVQLTGGVIYENGVPREIGLTKVQVENKITRGTFPSTRIAPKVLTFNQLTQGDVSTLVQFNDVEFTAADMGQIYADAATQTTVNRTIKDCGAGKIVLRTSGFANFATQLTPMGKGSVVGIYSRFGTTNQLYIRDTMDVNMTAPRCNGGGTATLTSIQDLRGLFTGAATPAPTGKKIKGVVISDKDNKNINDRNLILQDGEYGILVRFNTAHTFALGQSVEVVVGGGELSEFSKVLQVTNLELDAAISLGNGILPTPRLTTVADFITNKDKWESTLVKVENCTVTGPSFGGSKTLTDASGSTTLYTIATASFAGASVPGGNVKVTGIASDFTSGAQITMRKQADLEGGTVVVYDLNEEFNSGTANADIAITGWDNILVAGTKKWALKTFQTERYAEARGFQSLDAALETWLVSPPVNVSTQKTLNFRSSQAFWAHNGLTVWYATNFNGTNAATANWQPLNGTLAGQSTPNYEWVPSGNIALPINASQIRIGFKYVGDTNVNTTSYRIDDVRVN